MELTKKLSLLFVLCGFFSFTVAAQVEPVLRYDFSHSSGTTVTAETGGQTASLKGSAKVVCMGTYHVLALGTQGYLDLGSKAGSLVSSDDTLTVSAFYRVDDAADVTGNGRFLWNFSSSASLGADAGAYLAYRLNAQRVTLSVAGYNNETGFGLDAVTPKARWIHVCYVQTGANGRLYVDGEEVASATTLKKITEAFAASKAQYCWIGRSGFSGDAYLQNTLVSDFRIYDQALSQAAVQKLSAKRILLNDAYYHGGGADKTSLNSAIAQAERAMTAGGYAAMAAEMVEEVLKVCRDIAADATASQQLVDEYVVLLNNAVAMMKASAGFVFDDSGLAAAYDTQRGFIHPGGMHTQADFDRIKAQLAANDTTVTKAYAYLTSSQYAQPSFYVGPLETIVRGGTGENYINAARAAAGAYQNALRWKIEDNEDCAKAAMKILYNWATVNKSISGNSNYALCGIYGYEFAQAAELMRDYEGWPAGHLDAVKHWMLTVWYPTAINFMRYRNGTWENSGRWWRAPGHYWSNWGLCNDLCLIGIGIFCDDVFIYNQGMSYFKYDQVGTFTTGTYDRTKILYNDGLNEFLGNLVPALSESSLETGAYGKIGQMQESGRDIGHCAMAAGLAIDLAHMGYNQGDDLLAWMDHRLAAGMEYVAAQLLSTPDLPWVEYHYSNSGDYTYRDQAQTSIETAPALGWQVRPVWGAVVGLYEGVKGVRMPFAEQVLQKSGIDYVNNIRVSGDADHLGYSVLLNHRDGLCPADQVPTELCGKLVIDGDTIDHNDLGGLKNTYDKTQDDPAAKAGQTVTLVPVIKDSTADTGQWLWNTGATTREITVTTDKSFAYRVTYTNCHGIQSQQVFPIAVQGDCRAEGASGSIYQNGVRIASTSAKVGYGSSVTLTASLASSAWATEWSNGAKTASITLPAVTGPTEVKALVTNQGGAQAEVVFHLDVTPIVPAIVHNGVIRTDSLTIYASMGDNVILYPQLPDILSNVDMKWSTGDTGRLLNLGDVSASGDYSVTFMLNDSTYKFNFHVIVVETELQFDGDYLIQYGDQGYLTGNGAGQNVTVESRKDSSDLTQVWTLSPRSDRYPAQHKLENKADGTCLTPRGVTAKSSYAQFMFSHSAGTPFYGICIPNGNYLLYDAESGTFKTETVDHPSFAYQLIPWSSTGIQDLTDRQQVVRSECYSLNGTRCSKDAKGVVLLKERLSDGSIRTVKVVRP